jgi:hypothetical protein
MGLSFFIALKFGNQSFNQGVFNSTFVLALEAIHFHRIEQYTRLLIKVRWLTLSTIACNSLSCTFRALLIVVLSSSILSLILRQIVGTFIALVCKGLLE